MADFRKSLYALAYVALLAALTMPASSHVLTEPSPTVSPPLTLPEQAWNGDLAYATEIVY